MSTEFLVGGAIGFLLSQLVTLIWFVQQRRREEKEQLKEKMKKRWKRLDM